MTDQLSPAERALRDAAFEYHRSPHKGKIAVTPTKPLSNQRDLSLAYSPGVAYPCLAIQQDPSLAADFTALPQRCPGYAPQARAQAPPAPTPKTESQTDLDRAQTEEQLAQPTLKDNIMIVTDTGGSAFTPCPAGSYLARCVQLIDLGTQASNFEGQEKRARSEVRNFSFVPKCLSFLKRCRSSSVSFSFS